MKLVVYLINLVIVCSVLYRSIQINNDKAVLLLVFFYPILIIVNAVIGLILKIRKNNLYKVFLASCVLLIVLLIPVILICRHYGLMG